MDSFTLQSSPVSPGGTSQVDLNILDAPYFKAGQTAYDTGTGFWIGIDGGVPKISFGVSSGNKVTWNGTTLAVTGTLTATTGTIGGFTIDTDNIRDAADSMGMASTVTGGDDVRFWAGDTFANRASAEFRVYESGALVATSATITGAITATSGAIGGWTVGTDYIRDTAGTVGMSSAVTGGNDIRFWAGHATPASAPFKVTEDGEVTCSDITITGGSVDVSTLVGLIGLSNLNIAAQGWSQTCSFSVTDSDTVAWGAGTLTTAAGTAYSIGASNTGDMAAKTYIYLDIAVSTIAYQTTTTASTSVGAGKVLVAVAQNNTSEATFSVLTGQGGQNIDASSIVAASITGNEVAANTITAGNLSVSQLSAITADMGAITAGTITIDTTGYLRSGQTDYATGSGFFLGRSGGASKFSIGDTSTGAYVTWDGSTLSIGGSAVLGTAPLVKEIIDSGTSVTISTNYVMLLADRIVIDGTLTVNGTLCLAA